MVQLQFQFWIVIIMFIIYVLFIEKLSQYQHEPIWPNFKCYSHLNLSFHDSCWILGYLFPAPKYSKVDRSTLDYIKAQYDIS